MTAINLQEFAVAWGQQHPLRVGHSVAY